MTPEEALNIMRIYEPAVEIEHARAFVAQCAERGLAPFVEVHPLIMVNKKTGEVKQIGVKEHYNVAQRWAQQCGGYSVQVREVEHTEREQTYKDYRSGEQRTKVVKGWYVRIGILTNLDYAALAQMAVQIPGFDFTQEKRAFLHWGESFVPDSHYPPQGKDNRWLAVKRAREEAILNAFGREPSQARQLYALTVEDKREAASALYPGIEPKALPQPEPEEPDGVIDLEPSTPMTLEQAMAYKPGDTQFSEMEDAILRIVAGGEGEAAQAASLVLDYRQALDNAYNLTTPQGKRYIDLTREQLTFIIKKAKCTPEEKQAARLVLEAMPEEEPQPKEAVTEEGTPDPQPTNDDIPW